MVEDSFEQSCKKLNIKPVTITTTITPDVKDTLEEITIEDNTTIEEYLRDMIDDYILNRGI